jgi:hypothetical protein
VGRLRKPKYARNGREDNLMGNKELIAEPSGSAPSRQRWLRRSWADVGVSAFLMLVIAVPTMAVEEDWHGRPMIDLPTHLWLVPAFFVVAAFLVGGAVAGYRCRSAAAAAANAMAAGGLAAVVLVAGAMARRLWLVHEGFPGAVVRLWCIGLVATLVFSALGSQVGRQLTTDPD